MEDVNNLPKDIKIYTKLFYNFQKMMEDIHSITYETLLELYITEKTEKKKMKFSDITKINKLFWPLSIITALYLTTYYSF